MAPPGVVATDEEPDWLRVQRENSQELWGERLLVPEWEDEDNYRANNGWKGRDLIHDANSPVRITEYYVRYGNGEGLPHLGTQTTENGEGNDSTKPRGGVGTQLTGIVLFTQLAESHKGFCHGGSMCSVLDDVIGWCGFVATGKCLPWSGFTVQINTKLQKPIAVGSTLLVRAHVTRIERRKVSIEAELVSSTIKVPSLNEEMEGEEDSQPQLEEGEIVHASGEGLVVLNKGVLPPLATMGSFHKWPSSVELT